MCVSGHVGLLAFILPPYSLIVAIIFTTASAAATPFEAITTEDDDTTKTLRLLFAPLSTAAACRALFP